MFTQAIVTKVRNSTGSLVRTAALIGIIAVVAVPFVMLAAGGREANNLPWYIWIIVPLILVGVLAAGFARFRRHSHEAEDISIRPKSR
jgi:peptidoglycan/LPS O-acetylase OafA/YrhL